MIPGIEARAAFSAGLELRERHRWKVAAAAFGQALALEPQWADAAFWLAVSLDNRGQEQEAIPAYRRALELGLTSDLEPKAWTWLASSLSKVGESRAALSALGEADARGGYEPGEEFGRVSRAIRRRST